MTWYTLKWQDVSEGCIVEHFLRRDIAERREKEVKELSAFDMSYGIEQHTVKNGQELVEWLNHYYTSENG